MPDKAATVGHGQHQSAAKTAAAPSWRHESRPRGAALLIALDDEEGRDTAQWGSGAALAAALQLDLGRRDLLRTDEEKKIVAVEGPEPDHELLRDAHATIRASHKRYNAKGWVDRLARGTTAARPFCAGLVERGILSEERSRMLGVFTRTRFTEVNPVPERELRGRLVDILLTDREPTDAAHRPARAAGLDRSGGAEGEPPDGSQAREGDRRVRPGRHCRARLSPRGAGCRDGGGDRLYRRCRVGRLVVGDSRVSTNVASTLGIRRGRMLALGAAFPLWALTEPRRTRTTATRAGFEEEFPEVLVERTFHGRASAARPGQGVPCRRPPCRREPRPRWPWC